MAGTQIGEHHGHKRHADDELESNHNISKQFKKLRINHAPRQVLPNGPEYRPRTPTSSVDFMPVDETKDRIVIHDLAAEIAEIEATEPKTLFLPDIDRKVSAIPQALLQNQSGNTSNTQMVLYQVPSSISVPKEADAVRKAIIAARARARERQARELEKNDIAFAVSDTDADADATYAQRETHPTYDPDAMDLG